MSGGNESGLQPVIYGKQMGDGDLENFEEFAGMVGPFLHRTAWLLTHDQHRSEDLVQETFAKLYVAWHRRRTIDNPTAYARTVLVRLHLDERRRHRSSEIVTDEVPEAGRERDASASIALRTAMAGLPRTDQAVLILRFYADLSVAETARDLQISEGAVRTRTFRAVARLRERLGDSFIDDPDTFVRNT